MGNVIWILPLLVWGKPFIYYFVFIFAKKKKIKKVNKLYFQIKSKFSRRQLAVWVPLSESYVNQSSRRSKTWRSAERRLMQTPIDWLTYWHKLAADWLKDWMTGRLAAWLMVVSSQLKWKSRTVSMSIQAIYQSCLEINQPKPSQATPVSPVRQSLNVSSLFCFRLHYGFGFRFRYRFWFWFRIIRYWFLLSAQCISDILLIEEATLTQIHTQCREKMQIFNNLFFLVVHSFSFSFRSISNVFYWFFRAPTSPGFGCVNMGLLFKYKLARPSHCIEYMIEYDYRMTDGFCLCLLSAFQFDCFVCCLWVSVFCFRPGRNATHDFWLLLLLLLPLLLFVVYMGMHKSSPNANEFPHFIWACCTGSGRANMCIACKLNEVG